MANNTEDIKWLYDKLRAKGYDIGSQQEFTSSLANQADRDWYYDKAVGMGLDVGSKDDFNSLYAPVSAHAPQPKQEKTVQPQSAPQPQTPATETAVPQQTAQPTWQPTEQEKIRMSYNLNSMMSDFNARSRARVEQGRRVAERNTPEGRKKLKAAKFQAQLAGTPTQVLGLTPDVSPAPANGQGGGATGDQPKPLLSGQSPVPYGVVEVDGQRKTQWLLPDGTLTTDFAEADKAEYGARRVRLMNQFVGRMRENGLDPSKQEDVQRQAQLDYEAPIRKAVAAAIEADDKRSQQEQEAYMSDPLNMIGGVNAALGHAAARKQAGIGDLNLIAEKAYEALPTGYRRELVASYTDYFTKHPEATNGKTIDQAAQDAAKSVVYSQVHETYVGRNAPKSATEFFVRKMLELNPSSVALSSTINPYGQAYAELDAMERYGAEHRGLDIAGTVAGMAIDPTTYLSAGVGNLAFKGATRAAGKMMAKKAMGDVAGRYAATTLAGRLIGGIAAGGANFGTFEAVKDAERQLYQGGYLNPETGEMEGFSFGSVLNSGVHGVGMGAATGVVSPLIGNVADKAVKATSSTAGKVAMRGTEQLLSTVAEGTIFSIPEWTNGEQDAFDVWTDNMAMMAGFKLSHAVKTAPAMIRSLRPVKSAGDRPLTRTERIHNNKSFTERVRERMDASPSDIALTADEREELRKKGYGELSDLFSFDPEHKSRKAPHAQSAEGDYVGVNGLSRVVDYEPQADESGNRDFDGYEAMERLMEDSSVSEATRAKAYYILTGRQLPMSTVTGWTMDNDEDGNITVSSLSHQGGVVTSRRFKSNEEAQREIDRISRQAELNTIDIGEQYRNAEAQQRVMEAAIHEISPGADPQTVYNIYETVRRGDKNVTEDQRAMADMIDEAIERNSMAGDEVSPEEIRRRVSEETGVDVDKAIRKEPGKRTEAEQEAVKKYARALFPEEEAYEPTPEQAEADRVYENSRLLYGRFEQGDPEAQAEFDAISLRMTEAHQLCEEAFGDEAEVYMAQIKENPWGVLADPNLTSDQRDAVLYYINANAALDGVLDASNEAAADKRQKVQDEVAHRTHKERGVIVPATMKLDDRPTYIIKGDIAMFPDGSGVDVRNSSDAIIILDEQGEYKFVSPDQIMSVGETIDPQTELQTAYEAIDREQEAIVGAATGDAAETPENVPNSGEIPANGTETGAEAPESVPNVEEYDRGYEEGTEVAMSLADDILNGAIEDLRSRDDLSDEWRGRLEAYEYEQQRRLTEGTEAPSENIPQEGNNAGENIPEGEAEDSALSKIPVSDETGDPMLTHESVDAETAWDAAMEFFGTPEDALNYVQSEIGNAKTAISAAEKGVTKVKPTGGMTKYRDDLAKARAQVETSKATLAKWEAIAEVQKRRKAEETARKAAERAERDAQLHDEAVARFEEEQRIKAEKQAEQEAIGTHAVNPKIREKWTAAPKVDGHPDIITLPDGSTLTGHYVMTEAQAASASHDPESGFEPTEGFPIDANGQSVNDRDYKRDKDAQRIVQSMADAYDSRAMQTPVIVSKDGIVLSGNNRTMSGDIAAAQGTDGAYLEYLNKYGRKFGFTPEQVGGMKHPRVVFVPDDDLPYDANTFSRFNAQEMKSQSKPEAAIKLGKIVDDAVFNRIVADLNRYDRLSDFYADQEAAARTLGELVAAGAINDKQLPELRTGTALSAAGKELIENTLIGKTFQTEPDAVRMIISLPTLRQAVILGLGEIANNRTLANKGYDLSKELSAAVDLVYRARTSSPDIYKDGMPVSPFGRMQGLFDDEYGESRVTDETTLLLADLLNSGKPSDVRKVLSMYNQSAKESASGVVDIFSETGKPDTKEEILTRVNEHFRNASPKEQQALVEAAIEQRKRDAEAAAAEQAGRGEGGNEAEPSDERSAEPEQPSAVAPEAPAKPEPEYTPEEEALLARVEITDNDWEEEGKKPDKPIYKREIIIDGKHSVTQVDAPDDKGTYSGPYFEYDGKRFAYVGEVADYIDKQPTAEAEAEEAPINGLDGYSRQEVRDIVSREVEQILSDADIDAEIVGIEIHGSRGRGDASPESDLDIVLEYRGDVKEYAMFNAINEAPIEIEGIQVDVNPIRAEETGTLADYMKKSKAYDEEKLKTPSASGEATLGNKIAEAEATVNTNPTDAQKEAGNYKKGHVQVGTFDITIENPKGSTRSGVDADGKPWETTMTHTYGYIRGTEAPDGDHIDVYLSSDIDAWEGRKVFVVDQYNPDGSFDEHKVMLGFNDRDEAFNAYLSNYEKDWEKGRRLEVTEANLEDFEKWIDSSHRKTKAFADYKSVKGATETKGNAYTDEETGEQMYDTTKAATLDEFIKGLHSEFPETEVSEESRPKLIRYAERAISQGGQRHTSDNGSLHTESATHNVVGFDLSMMDKAAGGRIHSGKNFLLIDDKEGCAYEIQYKGAKRVGEPRKANVIKYSFNAPALTSTGSGAAYTITPSTYTNKKNKTSNVWHVKFDRDLTPEEKAALNTFIQEPLEAGRKTSRGWLDRKNGIYIMRSEEAARGLAAMIGNEEAIADAQPLSEEDYNEAIKPSKTEIPEQKPATPEQETATSEQKPEISSPAKKKKKATPKPKNQATLQEIAEEKPTEAPATTDKSADAPQAEPKGEFKVDDEMRSMEDELRSLLGIDDSEGDRGDLFRNPEDFTDEEVERITAIGIRYTLKYFNNGVTAFPDFADKMVRRMGEKIRPWLRVFYQGARNVPKYAKLPFTPDADVYAFDVMNFDKANKDTDPMRTAQGIVAEQRAEEAVAKGQQLIKEQRNQTRKENENQISANTDALAAEAEAIASQAEATAESAKDEREIAAASEKVDEALDKINEQLALLGYYEADPVEKDFNEAYGYMRNAEKKALADAVKLAKQLVGDLGIEIGKVSGTPTAKKSKTPTAVRANIAPAGGDITIALPLKEGRELHIYIGLDPAYKEEGEAHNRPYYRDDLTARSIMYRVENPSASGYDRYGRNCWADPDATYSDLLRMIERETYKYLPERTPTEGEYKSGEAVQYSADGGKKWTDSKVVEVNHDGTLKLDTGLAPVLYVNATLDQVRRKEGAKPSTPSYPDPKDEKAVEQWMKDNSGKMEEATEACVKYLTERNRKIQILDTAEKLRDKQIWKMTADWYAEKGDKYPEASKAFFDYGQHTNLLNMVLSRVNDILKKEQTPKDKPSNPAIREVDVEGLLGAVSDAAAQTRNDGQEREVKLSDHYKPTEGEKPSTPTVEERTEQLIDRTLADEWIQQSFAAGSDDGVMETVIYDKMQDLLFQDMDNLDAELINAIGNDLGKLALRALRKQRENEATQSALVALSGGKRKTPKAKKQEVKPEQTVGDLFGGLFDEPINDEKETELQTGTGTTEREEGHEPRQDQPVGTSQRNEDGGTDGKGMAGSGTSDTEPDHGRGSGVSTVSTEHAVESRPKPNSKEPLTRLPQKQRRNTHNHVIKRGSEIAPSSVDARIKANIEAIETMKRLTSTGADATPEDMKKLRAFSGWGGLGKAFSHWEYSSRLRKLIGEQAFAEDAQMSRNSAYFTPGYVVDAMWDVARALGFRGGKVLEGSAGIGNIIGLMPPEMSDRSAIQAVEKDSTTGTMLRLLYPDASVDVQGFEETKIQNGSIDLAITNVPFVPGLHVKDITGDEDLSKRFKDIHNFCIAKNVRKLRVGGIGIFITTKGTLDSTGGLYNWLTNEGNSDIVGLFRLHNETFGGTDATSDIIVVRKRVNGQKSPYAIDASTTTGVRTAEYTDDKTKKTSVRSLSYNRYFVEHPEHMAGEMKFGFETGNTYRPTSIALHPAKGKDQARMLKAWVKEMSQKDFGQQEEVSTEPMNHREEYTPTYDKAGVEVKTGSIQVDSKGRVCVNYDGTLRPLMSKLDKKNPKGEEERITQFNKNKVKGRTRPQVIDDYNEIKKALNELLDYQKNNEGDEGLQTLIDHLNRAYDKFVGYYGHLHANTSISWLKNDVDFPSVLALETYREEGIDHTPVFGKADIFRGRVMARIEPPKPQNIKDGVILSIRQSGNLNIDYIAEALNRPVDEVKQEIIKQGLGYENPTTHVLEPAHLYLSGNVREKLKLAEANNVKGNYDANISALRRVVPATVPSHMIEFSIGSSWLDPKLFNEYVKEKTDLNVSLNYAAGSWVMNMDAVSFPEKDKSFGVQSEICDKIIPGHELILAAMTNKTIRVSKTQKEGGIIYDPKATQVCASKVDEIRDDFRSWLRSKMQQDEKLATEIETTFNDTFNNSAPIEIPDEYVPERFEGAATVVNGRPLKLRPHQAKAVVRGTMQSLMLAHEVGTGKTYTLITTAMEMRRLGTAKKPMIVVQNSTLGQFVASAKALYPDARILSLEDKDRNAQGRKDFYAKIRYNDWDMVVIPQSVLEKIDDHPDRKRKFIEDTIAEKLDVLNQLAEDKENGRIVANMKKEIEKLQDDLADLHKQEETKKKKKDEKKEAIKKANAKIKAEEMLERDTDDNLNFDDLGIDAILVDEAHEYKHLGFATAMQRGVKGVDPSFSKKCQGLFLKVKAIQERSGGRNVVFATGTPISNTAAEIWTFMRYLMPKEEMEAYNIYYFDDFVRNFGSIQQMLEYSTSGSYKEVNRFAGYNNLPEMARLWAGVADTVKTEEAGEVKKHIPDLEGGKPNDIHLPQTSALRAVLRYVRQRLKEFEEMSGQEKKENSHIPLTMYGIAKAAAVDARLVSASAPDDPRSKTNEAVRQTLRSLKETEKYNGAVAIFADNYQRKNKETEKVEFNLFEDIKNKLINNGVPENQIWIMNSGMSAKKKEEIFSRVNSGEIRVIMGTTPLLGVGVNIQERLHTLMHLDAPNRPMDYWQRMGRLLRQGNLHKEMGLPVRVLRFGVEDSLDVTAYQRLKTKGAIADAVMNSKSLLSNNLENRVLEEEGDEFGQITAELSGSEYAILQNQTEKQLRKLLASEENHRQHQTYIHYKIPQYQRAVERTEETIEKIDETIATLEALPADKTISVNGKKFKSTEAMEELFKADNKTLGELIERAKNLGTTSTHIVRFTIDGKLHGEIKRVVRQEMVSLRGDMDVAVDTTVTILGITTDQRLKSRWLKANMNEVLELINPERFRRVREGLMNDLASYNRNIETLNKDRGKPFEHTARIAELKQLLEEYTTKLQADLAAKEKKYAEMDKGIADLNDITFTSEDDEEEQAEVQKSKGRELSRLVTEGNSLDFLDNQGQRSAFRYAQFVPGGLTKYGTGYVREGVRPPMTAIDSETQDWRAPMEFNEWEKSVEGMRKENGKADLVQGNGRTTGNVAYNPYFHIRVHPLNDQFSAAYDRPELVVVEGNYPESELTSGYRAEGAKNAVGLTDWHAGSVNGQLSPGKKVQTVLSRYFKPRRIVPWDEVAERIMSHIEGENVIFPLNVVPPRLRAELSRRGAKFKGISGSVGQDQKAHLEEVERQLAAGNHDFGVEGGLSNSDIAKYNERIDRLSSTDPNTMAGAVTLLSDKLHTPIRVVSKQEAEAEGYRRKKGWYDRETGAITIVADNHRNVGDIVDTAVHETVGHNGLRQLFETEEKLNNFLDEAYNISSDKIRQEIDRRTERMMDAEVERLQEQKRREHEERGENPESEYYADMAKARIEAEEKREQIRRDATEEYAADLGMKIGEEGFERMDAEELTFWGKMKGLLQKALDRLLAGLKLPKMRRWTDKEWSYVLWKSWHNLREGNNRYQGPLAEAEDITRRERSNFGADESRLFRDADMGLEEAITKMKADASAANSADFAAKQAAMRAIGGNLSKLRQAMARQREYDITTVKAMTDLTKIMMDAGLLDKLSNYEANRVLSTVKNAVGKQDTSKHVQNLMDIMIGNQLRNSEEMFGCITSLKGNKVDSRGIQIQGELDPDGQAILSVFNKNKGLKVETYDSAGNLYPDCILAQMNDAMDRMSNSNPQIAANAAIEYTGLQLARQYAEDIKGNKTAETLLRKDLIKAEEEMKAGQLPKNIYDQFRQTTEEAIREQKIKRIEAYNALSQLLGGMLGESAERAKAWKEANKERINRIHHYANSDMQGRELRGHLEETRLQKLANNTIVRFLLEPLSTLDQMLKMLGGKNANGEGYLYNFVMRNWIDSADNEQRMKERLQKRMDDKAAEIFGKRKRWYNGYMRSTPYTYLDLYDFANASKAATVNYYDGAAMRDYELTQDALMYLYAVEKMPMGRATNRRMGITEETMRQITDAIDPKLREYVDWVQEEFLPDLGLEMDEVHVRMFGAHMDSIDSYFPFVRDTNALKREVENGEESQPNDRISVQTGSIKKRVPSVALWNLRKMSFLDVLAKHVSDNAHWVSFAELNRDIGTLLSYNRLKQQVMKMSSVYGAGDRLWKRFAQCCAIATDAYEPKRATFDRLMVQGAKGVTMGKISFRLFTALKQTLSLPAFAGEINMIDLAKDLGTLGVPAVKWAWNNMPNFRKRILGRTSGDYRLRETEYDGKIMKASSFGMLPNIGVDAWTIAVGSHGVYETNKRRYLSWGLSEEQAEKRAVQDAELCFNKSQQSSEGPFMAPVQIDHTFYATSAMLFRNSSTSYTREAHTSARNLRNMLSGKANVDFMTKQILRLKGYEDDSWTDAEWADAKGKAKKEWRRSMIKNAVNALTFGWVLPWLWRIGGIAPLLLLSTDEDEKAKKQEEALKQSIFAPIEGLAYGDVIESSLNKIFNWTEQSWKMQGRENPMISDLKQMIETLDNDWVKATNDVLNIIGGMATGINPQTLSDWTVAIMDYCGKDAETSRECALLVGRLLSCPQSQLDHIYFDEIDATGEEASTMTPEEIAERYAEYKLHRNAPLTGWAYGEEGRKQAMDKHRKKAKTTMKERMTSRAADAQTRELLESFEEVADRQKEINKLKKSDREAYRAARKELRESTDLRRHNRVKRYTHDIKRLTEKWLNAKTATEADSLARAMTRARELMLSDIESYESNK